MSPREHLKVFGSITYAHVPKATRSKLDDKVVKTIFIGYKHEGYKLFNPMTKKVIVSRDVTFADEECNGMKLLKWIRKNNIFKF